MKALVTGCAGFIGAHLCEKLIKEGHRVSGLDCFSDFYARWLKERNVERLLKEKSFHFQEADLLTCSLDEVISKCFPGSGKSEAGGLVVFHLAAQPGVRPSWGENFDTYVENNILATQMLLEWAKNRDIEKFVYASSSSVYGEVGELPMREDSGLTPVSPYGVTKLAAENLGRLYWRSYGVPIISLRYFSVYGPRQRPDMAFHKFARAILRGEELEVYGDGSQSRDFTYVDDVVDATVSAVEGPDGDVFNIGGGRAIVLAQAIEILEEVAGRKAKLKYTSKQRGDMGHTFADIDKAREVLRYQPKVGLEEGLRKQIEWLEEILEAEPA